VIVSLDKTLIHHLESFKALRTVCTESVFWTLNRLDPIEVHYMEKNPGIFSSKTLISFQLKKERHARYYILICNLTIACYKVRIARFKLAITQF